MTLPLAGAGRPPLLQASRFLLVGAGANLLVLGAYYALTGWLGLPPTLGLCTSSAMGLAISYYANKTWTFDYAGPGSAARFVTGYAASLLFQLSFLNLAVLVLGIPHQAAVVLGLGLATLGSFLVQRRWVFPSHQRP